MWESARGARRTALMAAAAVSLAIVAAAASAGVRAAQPPGSTAPPTISGVARVGETLTAAPGSWSGDTPITFAYAWLRCDPSGGHCFTVGGATTWTYLLGPLDQGRTLRVVVTAHNATGSSQATSAPTQPVTGPSGGPTVSAPSTKADCKRGGWRRFTNPTFRNQGQCVSYVVRQSAKNAGRDRKHDSEDGQRDNREDQDD